MDAILAPAYLQQVIQVYEWLTAREAGQHRPAPTPRAWSAAPDREQRLYVEVTERLKALKPPARASGARPTTVPEEDGCTAPADDEATLS
jgi:hypothetical protein